jgi:aryl-alcohol dehydrogenase-like predicted oxidoreductase
VKYRKVPNTELNLSVVGFGCWAAGKTWWGDDVTDENTSSCADAMLDLSRRK